ncbi:aminopeptidase [Virgibacillus sp. SK37]|uniref:aminopeptidase n=1 Tax=Virgibacillus sp. SK37 TaxID=403957 RepID=UPI00119C9FD3|nr:aminopeptidase [Virgibacillus sp. SK37]
MSTFNENLEKYASLAIEVGANVQQGQTLVISAPISAIDFVRMLTKKAYEKGAANVLHEWSDDVLTRTKFELAPDETFETYPKYLAKHRIDLAENDAAFLFVLSSNPDLLNGIDPKRIQTNSKTVSTALATFTKYEMSDKISWSIVSVPNEAWAKKVFPELDGEKAVHALWDAIFNATRANLSEPVNAWKEHIDTLESKATYLNEQKFKALHYQADGTDLTIELPEKHIWISAESINEKGTPFVANIPTEEVFTAPLKTGVNGTVSATKPLSYSGNLIENFTLTFKNGKIVDYQAEKGYETLKHLIETDEGSHYIGEVALVPHHSPISDTDLIFFETLFDENASNHIAIGKGYAFCLEGGKEMSEEELKDNGLNDSLTHVDFMIGSDKMNIDGILPDGTRKPIFRKGNWAF